MTNIATETTSCGVDLGDKWSRICVVDGAGEVVEESRVRTTRSGFGRLWERLEPMRVVMEVGTHSPWASRLAQEAGHEVIVANARRVQLISQNERKSDEVDAELLARLGRADPTLLKPIRHRCEAAQRDLALVRGRAALVRARTMLILSVRGQVKSAGYRISSCSSESFCKRTDELPESLRAPLLPLMKMIGSLTAEIRIYDKRIEQLASDDRDASPVQTIQGVGPLTAVTFVRTLEDPMRFRNGRAAAAFLGLVPRRSQSGDSDPQLRITKCGDPYLRALLVNSAHYILGPFGQDSALRRWGLALAERGGKNAKARAVVAVARKLATIMYRLWSTGEVYESFPANGVR